MSNILILIEMKIKTGIFILITGALLIASASCKKSDELIPPEVNQPVELFSDSISVSSSDSGNVLIGDSLSYQITDSTVNHIKLQYYMETSGGNTGDRIYYGIFLSKPGLSYYSDYGYPVGAKIVDTTLTFNISNYRGLILTAKVAIERKIDNTLKYSKFKNIKLTKID